MAVFLIVWGALAVYRYKLGHNYATIHVRITGVDPAISDLRVETRSPWGSRGVLVPVSISEGRWTPDDGLTRPVASILISSAQIHGLERASISVQCGELWEEPSVQLQIRERKDSVVSAAGTAPQKEVIEIIPEALHSSLLSLPKATVNWQGDLSLLAVPALQSLVICMISLLGVRMWRVFSRLRRAPENSAGDEFLPPLQGWRFWMAAGLLSALCLLALHHIYINLQIFRNAQYANQFYQALAFLSIAAALVYLYRRWVIRCANSHILARAVWVFIGTTAAAKLMWVLPRISEQIGDFGIYWENGKSMAHGHWADLVPYNALKSIYAARALVYTYPIAKVFGDSLSMLAVVNIVIQSLTLCIFYLFCRRTIGSKPAALAVPLLAAYPEFWHLPAFASHDIPAIFWLVCLFYCCEILRARYSLAQSLPEQTGRYFPRMAIPALLFGMVTAILELQRSYMMFIAGAIVLYLLIQSGIGKTRGSQHPEVRRRWKSRMVLPALAVIAGTGFLGVTAMAWTFLEQRVPITEHASTLAYVTAEDSTTKAKYQDITAWRSIYYPAVADADKRDLVLRKLLFEKVVSGMRWWSHIWEKDGEYAGVDWTMISAMAKEQEKNSPLPDSVPWRSRNQMICSGLYVALIVLGLIRAAYWRLLPFRRSELFAIVFCTVTHFTLLALVETSSTYDMFWSIPLAVAGGAVLGVDLRDFRARDVEPPRAVVPLLIKGVFPLAGVVSMHTVASETTKRFCPPFGTLEVVSSNDDKNGTGPIPAEISAADTVRAVARFPKLDSYRKGMSATGLFRIKNMRTPGTVRFFLSGDQRSRRVTAPEEFIDVPLQVTLRVDGNLVFCGPIKTLETVRYLKFTGMSRQDGNHTLSVSLEWTGDWTPVMEAQLPPVGIEYCF